MWYLDNEIVSIRRQLAQLKLEMPTIYSVEPKNPTQNMVFIDWAALKVWDWSNWIIASWWAFDFTTTVVFTAVDYDTVSWSSWVLTLWTHTNHTDYAISPWSFDMTTTTYFYWQEDVPLAIQTTINAATAVDSWWILIAIWYPNTDITKLAIIQVLWWTWSSFYITTDQIAAWAVTSIELANWAVTSLKTSLASINPTNWELNVNTVWTLQLVSWAVTPTKITSYNFQISAWSFINNSPTAWKIAWANAKVVYNGTEYSITDWSCLDTDKHVYWQLASPNVFSASATLPALWNDDFLVLFNNTWIALFVWNSTIINGNRITSWSITATNIAANTLTANEIAAWAITTDEIAAWAVTAWKITSFNFILSAWTIADNDPWAWSVSWTWAKVVYNWTEHTITDWSTEDIYIYWQSSSPTVFAHWNTQPLLSDSDFIVFTNTSWVHRMVWNSTLIDWNRIVTWSIYATNIHAGTITGNEIAWSTITANKMNVSSLSAIAADLWSITAWTITVVWWWNTVAITPWAANAIIAWPTWTPTFTLTSAWALTATSWTIGWWTISANAIYLDWATDTLSSWMASWDYPFYAGKKYTDRATAPFRVSPAWDVVMTSATVTWALTTWLGSSINWTYIDSLAISKLLTGTISSKQITLWVTWWTWDCYIAAWKTDFTTTTAWFILGLDDSDSDKAKFYLWDTNTYIYWDWTWLVIKWSLTLTNTISSSDVSWLAATATSSDFASVTWVTKPSDNADVSLTAIQWWLSISWWWLTLSSSWASIKWWQTAYDTWTWFWLWEASSVYKFSIWNSSWNKMTWDGTTLWITGTITGGTIQTASSWRRIELTSANWLRVFDWSWKVRIRLTDAWGAGSLPVLAFFDSTENNVWEIWGDDTTWLANDTINISWNLQLWYTSSWAAKWNDIYLSTSSNRIKWNEWPDLEDHAWEIYYDTTNDYLVVRWDDWSWIKSNYFGKKMKIPVGSNLYA
jgi:hypothetical protein